MSGLGMGLGLRKSHGPLKRIDPAAAAFFAATGITDAAQKKASNQLVVSLKAIGLWSKFSVLYPFVGGSASAHSFNLKDPSTYQITWHGTLHHDANGVTGDGATGYGDTGLPANGAAFVNNLAFGVYNRTAGNDEGRPAISSSDETAALQIYPNYLDGNSYFDNTEQSGRISFVTGGSNETGLQISSRVSSSLHVAYQNGIGRGSTASTQGLLPAATFKLPSLLCARNLAFGMISTGLSVDDVTAISGYVQEFQTALERGV